MNVLTERQNRVFKRFRLWSRRTGLSRKLAYALTLAAVVSGIATVVTMTSIQYSKSDPRIVIGLLYLDAILLLLLGGVIARRLVEVWSERRRGMAGSGLHLRFVIQFSLVAVTPAILVAVFSAAFLNFGLQAWFSERVRTALEASNAVATAYLYEHQQSIRSDISAMANELNRNAPSLMRDKGLFDRVLSAQADARSLPEAVIVDSVGRVLVRSALSLSLSFDLVPESAIKLANKGQIAVLTNRNDDRVRAVTRLDRFVDAYLLVGRFVDSEVLEHISLTEQAVAQFFQMEKSREGIQITFVMIFVVVALLLLLAAVWLGLTLATQLVQPISNLITAAEKIGKGDLGVRVQAVSSSDEIGTLSRTFNKMTQQMETQQHGLMDANRQLDERRRFTETVLAGVSAGVIGLDDKGHVYLPNRSASELLGINLESRIGDLLSDVIPEMNDLLGQSITRPGRPQHAEIKIMRKGEFRTLMVGIAAERLGGEIIGYVVTFDDVSELLSAQRKAAWSDVARRIAHEIKNPLTPIQLSAERLKRKYQDQITEDPEIFITCTDTIIRQVADIGRMVDEFSSFARMPHPIMKTANLTEICRQSVFLERTRNPEIEFVLDLPDADVTFEFDDRQIAQAMTNILKNAAESVLGRDVEDGQSLDKGEISVSLTLNHDIDPALVSVSIADNGSGLPKENRELLMEPYITTRDSGTGLGLAIVKKIMEDHNGNLILEDRDPVGAVAVLNFHPAMGAGGEGEETTPESTPAQADS